MGDTRDWYDNYNREDPRTLEVRTEAESDVVDQRYYLALKFFHAIMPFVSLTGVPPEDVVKEFLQCLRSKYYTRAIWITEDPFCMAYHRLASKKELTPEHDRMLPSELVFSVFGDRAPQFTLSSDMMHVTTTTSDLKTVCTPTSFLRHASSTLPNYVTKFADQMVLFDYRLERNLPSISGMKL